MRNIFSLPNKKNIVVIGAGFAGVILVLKLSSLLKKSGLAKKYSVILIDKNAHHLYAPALYEIASIPRDEASAYALEHAVCIPIELIIKEKHIQFLQRHITSINRFTKTIFVDTKEVLEYDHLIIAAGSETNDMNIPGIREYSFPLKSFKDAVFLRNRIEAIIREKKEIKVIVGGAGSAGVELIAEFNNYLCYLQKHILREKKCDFHLELIEASDTILPGMPEWIIKKATKRLRDLGINIRTHSLISTLTKTDTVLKDGAHLPYDIFIWTGGVKGAKILETLSLPLTKRHSVTVNEFLQPPEDQDIFVIGDSGTFINPNTQNPVPWTVPVAEGEARLTAQNLVRKIMDRPLRPYRPLRRYPMVISLGQKMAVADLLVIRLTGFFGWCTKVLIDLRYFATILPLFTALRLWCYNIKLFISND